MNLLGNRFSAEDDEFQNWTITRLSDGARVYIQGLEALEFINCTGVISALQWPSQTTKEKIDRLLEYYEPLMDGG
jgi:hypothetical protein